MTVDGVCPTCHRPIRTEVLTVGDLRIDRTTRTVSHAGRVIRPLPAKAFSLLVALAEEPTRIFTRAELYESVWGFDYSRLQTRTLDSHASRLRRVLPGYVSCSWGIGYSLTAPPLVVAA